MGTKSFFNKQKTQQVKMRGQEKSTIQGTTSSIESIDYVKEFVNDKFDFVPQLDFEEPKNFVKYGLAEDYYADLVDSVVQSYPYDGSLAERLNYRNGLTAIQKHEFDKNYPRSVGYADFTDESWAGSIPSTFTVGTKTFGFGQSSLEHYIITDNYSNKLIYNTGSAQVGSIELNFSEGATVEFWLNKTRLPDAGETQNEVIFSISNDENDLFQIVTDVTASSKILASFSKALTSAEFVYEFETNLTTIADSKWHHYAFAFSTNSAGYTGEFYVDGKFQEKKFFTNGSPKLLLTGTLDATVGASSLGSRLGDGKVEGLIDEVRLWKVTRDAKQIGTNYFFDVGGGGNTDATKVNDDNPLGLSLYYKFNEGNTGVSSVDSVVLDYSGRLTDGVWFGYNTSGHISRPTGSAIIQSGVTSEPGSPIIYATHPDVVTYKADKILSGSAYDATNLGSLYNMLPHHISDEDSVNGLLIRKLMQIMSSYLDTLHAQITAVSQLQDGTYVSGSNAKPNPFSKRNLLSYGFEIPEVFIDPGVIQEIYSKDDKRLYEEKLFNLKNLIFQNIFNNLNYINKTKGTEKSFRNLFRCFGVDNELVRLNMYADNQQYELRENFESSQTKRNAIDLSGYNDSQNRDIAVYTFADPEKSVSETGDFGFIPSSSDVYIPLTFETQVQFPKYVNFANGFLDNIITASLFGVHSASGDKTTTTIGVDDLNFKVFANTNINNKTQFVLSTNIDSVGTLTSSFYEDVYDNTNWTFAVRTKPREYPFAPQVTASNIFDFEFYGVNYIAGYKLNEFSASAELNISGDPGDFGKFITGSNKRLYLGANRTNVTGTLINETNARFLSTRVWFDNVTNNELQNHARDISVFGRANPYNNSFLYDDIGGTTDLSTNYIPKINTLALHWNFENITGSGATGKFLVQDITSGSSYSVDPRFTGGEYSKYVGINYSGQGAGATANSTNVVDFVFVDTAEQQLPENLYSSDLVEIRERDDTLFTRESRPSKYYFSVETSLYDTISRDMLNFFASINDFNNLIGEPVNMYRPNFKNLEKLKELFFENVQNEPDLDRYIKLYKWLDGALDSVVSNLIPASAKTSDKIRNIIESHILERSKYRHKYITLKQYTKEERIKDDPDPFPNDIVISRKIDVPKSIVTLNGPPIQNVTNIRRLVPLEIRKGKATTERTGLRPKPKASELPVEVKDLRAPEDPTTLSIDRQDLSPLWYRTRVERGEGQFLAIGVGSVDDNRIQTKVNQSQIATGSRQPTYTFRADAQTSIGQNVGYSGENRGNYFPNTFRNSIGSVTEDGIAINVNTTTVNNKGQPFYDYSGSVDETYGDRPRVPLQITDQVNSTTLTKQSYLPFDVLSASQPISPYEQVFHDAGLQISLAAKHQDFIGIEGSTLQGPFSEKHVGGFMYRHNDLLETRSSHRKEGYQLNIVHSTPPVLYINSPRMISNSAGTPAFNSHVPLGFWTREQVSKSPVSIKNISGSNYFRDYEIVQTTGRRENNRYYVKSSGLTGSIINTSSLSYDEDGVFFFKEFTILDRSSTGSNQFVIVNRFSAPGGPEVNSFAYLDVEAAEYSVYNNLNYRNLVVRIDNNELLTRHTLTGGFDSVLLQPDGAFYKTQRNGVYKISASLATVKPTFDNSYVAHGIPRTDVQYSWLAASWIARKTGYPNDATLTSVSGLLTGANINPVFHQNVSDFNYDISSSDYSPIYGFEFSDNFRVMPEGHIEYGVGSGVPVSVAFNSTNYIIVGEIDTDNNLFTTAGEAPGNYYNLPDFEHSTAPFILNGFLLNNNGPYQHPTFKQIRHGEHRVARELKLKNIYRSQKDKLSDSRKLNIRFGQQHSIVQAPITNKYKPILQLVDRQTGTIQYELGNDLDYFANTYDSTGNQINDLNLELGAPVINVLDTDFYKFSSKYELIKYSEVAYPKQENQYRDIARNRERYASFFISDEVDIRTDNQLTNSQGDIIAASQWPMDVSTSGSGQVEKSGELMRNTGSTGAGLIEGEANARYSFQLGECRPENFVQLQAGTGAFFSTYGEFSTDTRLLGQDETVIPEFVISDVIESVVAEFGSDFLAHSLYSFTLTGSQNISGNHFAENYGKTEKITYLEQLKEFYGEPTAIKLTFDTTKKLLPREGFYPQQRVVQLAQQFSSSYKNSTILGGAGSEALVPQGGNATYSTTLMPFWAPGIGLNSIKAGFAVEFPYKSGSNNTPTASLTEVYDAVAPFESIISPSEFVTTITHIANSGSFPLDSTGSVNKTDGVYELMAHNFFSEVPEFFLEGLVNFKSSPESQWQFEGPLSTSAGVKKFAMDIVIASPAGFVQYGNPAAFGPYPYTHHMPPGSYSQTDGTDVGLEACGDLMNVASTRGGNTRATLVFDPTELLTTTNRSGQTTFSLADIVANSTIQHSFYLIEDTGPANLDFMRITASVDLFELGEDNRWTIRSKWECPTLNFNGATATTDGSKTATKGMWHQYATVSDLPLSDQERVHLRLQETQALHPTLTGSLIQAVGFEQAAQAFGKIKPRKIIEESICAAPFFVDCETGEEKFFELPINIFENRYSLVRRGTITNDSISDMIRKMDKYILPPPYDFVHVRDKSRKILTTKKDFEPAYPPFAMYFFEFSSELSRQDLANIWQGVMPTIATQAEKERVTIEHPIADGELLSPSIFSYNGMNSIPNDIRWKIFKVKKRANQDYYKMLEEKTGVRAYKTSGADRFSFNYPYDQFSLVELGKMEVEFEVENDSPSRVKKIEGGGYITPEQILERAVEIGQPVEIRADEPLVRDVVEDTNICSDEDARELQLLINKSQPQQSALGGPTGGVLTARETSRLRTLLAKCPRPSPITQPTESFEFVPLPETFTPFTPPEREPERAPEREPEFTSPQPERTAVVTSTPATTFATAAVASFEAIDISGFDPDSPAPGSVEAGDPETCTDDELAELQILSEIQNDVGDAMDPDSLRRLQELLGKC